MNQATDPFDEQPQPWWHHSVVYQIYPRSFADSDGDGVGDLAGATKRLDYIAQLGADVVWLSPFFPSPQVDAGYDITDYCGVDPQFGTLDDFDAFVREAHTRGIKVLIDLVFNHTSDAHPWFVESRDPASPKRDWYYWRPAREGYVAGMAGAEPTNWGAAWGGPAWKYDAASGEYYLHLFSEHQADLNWHHPGVRAELARIARWWIERGADGFRFDVINYIGKPAELHDGPGAPGELCYDIGGQLDPELTHRFLAELRREGFGDAELLTVGEMPGCSVDLARSYTDPERRELSMVFSFEHMDLDHGPGGKFDPRPLPLPELKRCIERWQHGMADLGWNSLYWCNHDQPRVVSRWGDDSPEHRVASAKAWATVLHLLRGTPYVYQGEELGMTNANFEVVGDYRDIESRRFYADATIGGMAESEALARLRHSSRDNARTPMQWSDDPSAGFTSGEPWIGVNANYPVLNATEQLVDPESVFQHYRALIALRHELTLIGEGDFELLLPEHETLFAYRRTYEGQMLLVLANMSSEPLDFAYPEDGSVLPPVHTAVLLLDSHDRDSAEATTLRPWESRAYLWSS